MKKIISFAICITLILILICGVSEILIPKSQNRYYILNTYLENHPEENLFDVKIFGSCHAYTSFNPVYMEECSGISGFAYANAGEIIPTTYVQMVDQFKKHTPKVAVVEIWGINPYETYIDSERVFGDYLAHNLELRDFSLAKQEVILDFQNEEYNDINLLSMNVPFLNYKDRLLDNSLTTLDFNYDFTKCESYSGSYNYNEMLSRLKNNGFKSYSSTIIKEYPEKQKNFASDEMVEIEPDIVKYIQKIIDLCKEKNVELIFYRAPYVSTANELKKVNHFKKICEENDVLFLDLEKELSYDYKVDLFDYQHLSEVGANKSTEFLLPYIASALGQTWDKNEITRENQLINSDFSGEEAWESYLIKTETSENGKIIELTEPSIGWILYQDVEISDELWGTSVTASFDVADCAETAISPLISCYDAQKNRLSTVQYELVPEKFTISSSIPARTKFIRVGLHADEGSNDGDYVTVKNIQLFYGAFSVASLPQ